MTMNIGGPNDTPATNHTGAWSMTSLLKGILRALGLLSGAGLTVVASGCMAGATSAEQLPEVTGSYIQIKARLANAGNIYIGGASVTAADGSTSETAGYELGPGDSTGWIAIDDLSRFWRVCDDAGDALTYMVLA